MSNASNHEVAKPTFNPQRCLFCSHDADKFDSSLLHMQTAHGLFIPDRSHLVVDPQTLVEYLHLLIFGYNECIWCGTVRSSPEAIQQHMTGKSHCRFDIADEDSEYADFYDFSDGDEDESDVAEDSEYHRKNKLDNLVQPDDGSLRLPSGRIISNRSSGITNSNRQQRRSATDKVQSHIEDVECPIVNCSQGSGDTAKSLVPSKGPSAVTRKEKQETALSAQLARLSVNDRMSLAHLPVSKQRAVLATQQKQLEKARRLERRYRSHVEGLGNKTLMKHFVPDTPGRTNG